MGMLHSLALVSTLGLALATGPSLLAQDSSQTGFGADLSLGATVRADGVGTQFSALFPIGGRWRVGLQGLYYEHRFDSNFFNFIDFTPASIQPLYLLPTVTYTFHSTSRWRLYAGLSAGVRLNTASSSLDPRWVPGLLVGAEYAITHRWYLTAQVSGMAEDKLISLTDTRQRYSGPFVAGSIGVGYRLGRRNK